MEILQLCAAWFRDNSDNYWSANKSAPFRLLSQSEQNNLIKLSIRDSMMAITSNNEKGNVYEEVALSLEGDYLDIAFNSRYLLEGLKNIDCEEIYIEFTTNVNPCIIKPADGTKYTYLLLPVRISSNN